MIRRDYTQEIGLESPDKKVPWPIVVLAFAAIAAGLWFATSTRASTQPRGGSESTPAAHASSAAPHR